MSTKELSRLDIVIQINSGAITQRKGAEVGLSERQTRRLMARYRENGAIGFVSCKRGNVSNHQLASFAKELALDLIKKISADFGPMLTKEKLLENIISEFP